MRHGPTSKVKAPFLFGRRTYYIQFHLYNDTFTRDQFKGNMTALTLTHARSKPVMTAQACHTLAYHIRANMDSFSSISRPFRRNCRNCDAFVERMGALTFTWLKLMIFFVTNTIRHVCCVDKNL